jgi:hypothetical protein
MSEQAIRKWTRNADVSMVFWINGRAQDIELKIEMERV